VIDWRSETHETINHVDPMLRRHGIRDFDWSFVDALEQKGNGIELRNNNFLCLLRDQLRRLGLTLAHINLLGDSYAFAVLRSDEFAKINGMSDPQAFAVSDDFGADEAYARGKRLLANA
jgi:hypothetical protein